MTDATPTRAQPRTRNDLLREQIAPEANDGELSYLDAVAQRFDLDPIAGQIVLIGRYDKRVGRKVHRPTITVEGRHVIAERTGELVGIDGPYWTGARNPDGTHTWVDVWDEDEYPHAARVFVHRVDRLPANGTVRWKEFAQFDNNGKLMPTWRDMPAHMLGKSALSLGLRRAFAGLIPADLDIDMEMEATDTVDVLAAAGAASSDVDSAASHQPAPATAFDLITAEQRARIGALLVACDITDAGDQLAFVGELLDRELVAPGRMTKTEAAHVITYLETESPARDDDAPPEWQDDRDADAEARDEYLRTGHTGGEQ